MKNNLTRKKVSPKSHKKIIAFVYADNLVGDDVVHLENYLEARKDLHHIYIVVSNSPDKQVRTVCNRYNHLKLIHSQNPKIEITDIKKQYDGVDVKFEEREFDELKKRSF